jgi:hypothetical protein
MQNRIAKNVEENPRNVGKKKLLGFNIFIVSFTFLQVVV